MKSRLIFCTSVSLTILAVILLSTLSPIPYKNNPNPNPNQNHSQTTPSFALSLYIQQPSITRNLNTNQNNNIDSSSGVFTYRCIVTEGPYSTSRVVGKAQGLIIPAEDFAHSAFNIIYLTFDTPGHSGSLSVQAREFEYSKRKELVVVGGTGAYAYARGVAVFEEADFGFSGGSGSSIYLVSLRLTFPDRV